MIKVEIIRTIIAYITIFLAYLVVITPSGFFRAWVAKKMGDDSAERYGLLSLNPFDHVDIVGLLMLFWTTSSWRISIPFGGKTFIPLFGWGKFAPLDINKIRGKYFNSKLISILFSGVLMYIFVGVAALFLLGFIPKITIQVSVFRLSSLKEVIASILAVIFRLSAFLFLVNLASGVVTLIRIHLFDRYPEHTETIFFTTFALMFLLLVFFSGQIHYIFNTIVYWIHFKISSLVGVH